ncbi:MAG TPA: hypothetical protein VFV07_02525 [Rhizomicrobium sp.]|nr:hypothetical protein [Rhizomicrobium sp.]
MANPNKTRPNARKPAREPRGEALRESVFLLSSEMEEPLRHAMQMVRLIGLVDPKDDDDKEAIGFVAHEAVMKLHAVTDRLRKLFAACG